jgi:propanediol dehydratase large subunit
VGAKILPYLIGGSDLICSGFGSILKYDNSFNPSLLNGEELEDYLVLQRDFEADGGLTPIGEERALDLRIRAVEAIAAVFDELELGSPSREMKASVVVASGSDETASYTAGQVAHISEAIKAREINVLDVIRALVKRGFREEAENLLYVVKLRISGDYLQTSAMVRNGHILSAVNDPNDYLGPGTGYRVSEARRQEINGIRDLLDRETVISEESEFARHVERGIALRAMGPAAVGSDPREVVIGVSPAFGVQLFRTLSGIPVDDLLKALVAGIAEGGGIPRIVRLRHTADTSFLGLSAARLSGSKVGIGIQTKGTAVIHHADRLPHNNLELFSNAPITNIKHYQALGFNAARHARGEIPEPVVVPQHGEAMGSRYHARVALIYAIETSLTVDGAAPEEIAVSFREVAA